MKPEVDMIILSWAWEILLNDYGFYTLEHFVGNTKPMGIAVCKCKKSNQ